MNTKEDPKLYSPYQMILHSMQVFDSLVNYGDFEIEQQSKIRFQG